MAVPSSFGRDAEFAFAAVGVVLVALPILAWLVLGWMSRRQRRKIVP